MMPAVEPRAPSPGRPAPDPAALTGAAGLVAWSASAIAAAVGRGDVSAVEVVEAHLARVQEVEPHLHALLDVHADGAWAAARAVDTARASGRAAGPLAGVPVVMKDNVAVRGRRRSCASLALRADRRAADAEVVRRLRLAGAVVLGSANLDEFAMGASTETSAFGASRNPHDLARTPGGSSGGCAAAVAGFEVPLAVGTDTGGSVREPAAQCGLLGLAPSPRAVPMQGVVPFAPELDRVGPLARTAADLALLTAVLTGTDAAAAARIGDDAGDAAGAQGLRVGLVTQMCGESNRPDVLERLAAVVAALEAAGAEVAAAAWPSARAALAPYYAVSSVGAVPSLARHVGTRLVGPEATRRYHAGLDMLDGEPLLGGGPLPDGAVGPTLADARDQQRVLRAEARDALDGCDVLLSPTMPVTAPRLGGHVDDPLTPPRTDWWTVQANLVGAAAVSVPCGRSAVDGMPVGVQAMARAGDDHLLLRVAALLEAAGVDTAD